MKHKLNKKNMVLLIGLLFIGITFLPIVNGYEGERSDNLDIFVEHLNDTTIMISVYFPEFEYSSVKLENNQFALVNLENVGRSEIEGQARLPVIRKMIEIPQDAMPNIEIHEVLWEETSLVEHDIPLSILPVQPFQLKTDDEVGFLIDDDYYNLDRFTPDEVVKITEIQEIRGRRFAVIEITPVQYNPFQGDLKLMMSCNVIMNLPGSNMGKTIESIERYSSSSFEELYAHIFSNYGYYEHFASSSKNSEGYLIIVDDTFMEEIAPLVDWKNAIGYDTTVTLTSEIPNGVTAENIKAYIEEAYDTWANPPAYILLVGDNPQIPAFTSNGGVTDTPFVTMDGDSFPDIYIGRFPAASETHVETMVEKTLYYESGSFDSYDWIKKAVFMASVDNYQISEGTHNYVIDTHLEPNGYICDKLYQVSYGATTQDVRDSLNDGRSLAIFSGHGSTTAWGDGPPFSQSDVNSLTNNGMYPFVCSHSCLTGKFSVGECFGETWVRAPNKGAIAFWGSSINTQWDPDDIIEKRVFDAWWYENLERIGQMTDKGMYDAYLEYGSGMIQFVKSYNVLGDTSLKIWRDDATNYDVYQSTYDRGFPIRHALDGDWAAAQSFTPRIDNITGVDIYLRKFGTPEFDLVVELREDNPNGILIDSLTFSPEEVDSNWGWFTIDVVDVIDPSEIEYFIVIPPTPSGVTTSFGYEWGYAIGDPYPNGSFWFTRDGGGLWRGLPDSYEFTFRTY